MERKEIEKLLTVVEVSKSLEYNNCVYVSSDINNKIVMFPNGVCFKAIECTDVKEGTIQLNNIQRIQAGVSIGCRVKIVTIDVSTLPTADGLSFRVEKLSRIQTRVDVNELTSHIRKLISGSTVFSGQQIIINYNNIIFRITVEEQTVLVPDNVDIELTF